MGDLSPTHEEIATANWIIDPSRPIAAPVATEKAEEAVRQTVARRGIRPSLRRTASTYSSKRRSGADLRIIQSTRVANAAPIIGVRIRRAGGNVAAAIANIPVCSTKTHGRRRKKSRTATQAEPLAAPRTTAQPMDAS